MAEVERRVVALKSQGRELENRHANACVNQHGTGISQLFGKRNVKGIP